MARIVVGLSGYSYKPWQGEDRFYPPGLKAKEFLAYYAERYTGVEMDSTWYRMPSKENLQAWMDGTPDGFMFTFKAHRKISHIARLKPDCFDSVDFLTDRLKPVHAAGKLGCVFVQLPPNFKKNAERLRIFCEHLNQDLPWGIEFRNETWNDEETDDIMRQYQIARVAWEVDEADGVRRDTGRVLYTRMRKEEYSDELLDSWAEWFKAGRNAGKNGLIFFKHEDEGSPWVDADRFLTRLD